MTTPDNGQHFASRTKVAKKNLTFFREAGRGKALVQINNVVKFHPGIVLLMGEEGSGRSRVLKQFADSLKDKPGSICILERALKNEEQLYGAIADGFALDLLPGENLKSVQKAIFSFLEKNIENNKPTIIALDNTNQCSLAVLEALISLRVKFKSMSLILLGDTGLEKMLQRLQAGKLITSPVLLAPLDAREIRQYMNWRLHFQMSDHELIRITNASRGNIGLLEQEALKAEVAHRQKNALQVDGSLKNSRGTMIAWLVIVAIISGAATVYYFNRDRVPAVTEIITRMQPLITDWMAVIPGVEEKTGDTLALTKNVDNIVPVVRSNQEWVEQQVTLLTGSVYQ